MPPFDGAVDRTLRRSLALLALTLLIGAATLAALDRQWVALGIAPDAVTADGPDAAGTAADGTVVAYDIAAPPEADAVVLSADYRADGIGPGRLPWHRGRIAIVPLTPDGSPDYGRTRNLVAASGSTNWEGIQIVTPVPDSGRIRLLIGVDHATGRLSWRDMSLVWAEKAAWMVPVTWALLSGFAAMSAFAAWQAASVFLRRWPPAVLLGVLLPVLVVAGIPLIEIFLKFDMSRETHFAIFALFTLSLAVTGGSRWSRIAALSLAATLAIASEGVQALLVGEAFREDGVDLALDISGIAAGGLVAMKVAGFRQRRAQGM
ncbi:hypothetical protein [Inquilinus sp. CAU 1745]|uniref:hypothetical protein n=1 Tax=Inquilinus sp. CAU 1745 TaxID=3140369 RepID=UPI00325A4E38